MANLPPAGTGTEMYLAAILDKLGEIDQRIEELAADMQAEPEPGWADIMDLREPAVVEATPGGEPMTMRIPGEFPGASSLYEAGITTMADIPSDEKSLVAIPGIGKATARAIIGALGE